MKPAAIQKQQGDDAPSDPRQMNATMQIATTVSQLNSNYQKRQQQQG